MTDAETAARELMASWGWRVERTPLGDWAAVMLGARIVRSELRSLLIAVHDYGRDVSALGDDTMAIYDALG